MTKENLKKKEIAIYFGSAIAQSERPNKKRWLTLEMIKNTQISTGSGRTLIGYLKINNNFC